MKKGENYMNNSFIKTITMACSAILVLAAINTKLGVEADCMLPLSIVCAAGLLSMGMCSSKVND